MKKTLIALMTLVVVMTFAYSPALAAAKKGGVSPFHAGALFGLNISTAVSDQANWGNAGFQDINQNKRSRNGLVFGGIANLTFSEWISLQAEVRYSMKGVNFQIPNAQDQAGNVGTYKINMKVDYLEIPIYFKFSVPTGTLFTPDVMFGPALGIKLSASTKYTFLGNSSSESGQVKGMDFGLGFGGGGRFAIGPGSIFLNFLYNLGLSNVNNDPQNTSSIKNRCLSIVAGYLFNFKTR